jgi:hypothetical protein
MFYYKRKCIEVSSNLVKFINELQSKEVHEKISKMISKDLSNSYVRVEVICDREGFWLKPHCDIKEKVNVWFNICK